MPFVFGIAGILLLVAGVRGKTADLFALVKSDFSGQPNYFEWMVAIFLTGSIGYVKELQTISRMFMFLLILGLLFKNRQVFQQFTTQETANAQPSAAPKTNSTSLQGPLDFSNLPPIQ